MRAKRNRILFAFLTLTLVGVAFSGWLLRATERKVTAAQAPPETVCYSLTNKQGWTGTNSGIPPSLDFAVGGMFSQYRFELSCTRVGGVCKPFGEGSRIFLDHDGPNGPQGSYEQNQFYYDDVNPSAPPMIVTIVDSQAQAAQTTFTFNLRYGTTDETLRVKFQVLWLSLAQAPLAGNAPTLDELNHADSGIWFDLNHAVADDPVPVDCVSGGVRAQAPAGPVWVDGVRRCGTFNGIPFACCLGALSDATSSGLLADIVAFAPTACPTLTINPTQQSFPAAGGAGSFAVTVTGDYTWQQLTQSSFITISYGPSLANIGNGTANFTVASNPNATPRTGTIRVWDKTFTVLQAGTGGGTSCVVTTTANSGAGSLRQAITDNNAGMCGGLITFNIPTSDPGYVAATQHWSIKPTTGLPVIALGTIDGLTQPGASNASWPPTLKIELDGSNAPSSSGLAVGGSGVIVRGLVINRFSDDGVNIQAVNARLEANYLGVDVTGTLARANGRNGVSLTNGMNHLIGGATADKRNLISANTGGGIQFSATTGNQVVGNYLGTNAAGTGPLGNGQSGVVVSNGSTNNTIGGTAAGAGNLIAYNGGNGVSMLSTGEINNRLLGNTIFANELLGIDLSTAFPFDGVTLNDPGDADTGRPNNLQNFPVLSSISASGVISGSLDSLPANTAYPVRIEFFANTACDASTYGEGESYLGSVSLAAPGSFTSQAFTIPANMPFLTATATDANGNTSEFSRCRSRLTVNPSSVAAGTAGQSYPTVTFTATNAIGAVVFMLTGALPNGLTFAGGALSGTPTQAGSFPFTVAATDDVGSTGSRAYTLVIACPTAATLPTSLPNGTSGTAYNASVAASPSGTYNYSFTGALPSGLTLNTTTGAITGVPNTAGTFNFTVTATRFGSCAVNRSYAIVIACSAVVEVLPKPSGPMPTAAFALPAARVGQPYTTTISANPAGGSYSFSLIASPNQLPAGLTLNSSTGVISGTTTAPGNYVFRIQATPAGGCAVASRLYSLRVNP